MANQKKEVGEDLTKKTNEDSRCSESVSSTNVSKKRILVNYIICFAIGFLFVFIVLANRDIIFLSNIKDIYQALCDAFCVPGVILMLFGLLFRIAGEGTFDGLGYAFKRTVEALLPFYRKKGAPEKYSEYKERKNSGRTHKFSLMYVVVTGLVFFVISLIFLALYYSV